MSELQELCCDAIRQQIDRLQRGEEDLRVPVLQQAFVPVSGKHFHFAPELFIQLSGLSVMEFPKECCRAYADSILLIPKGVPHRETAKHYKGRFHNLVFEFGRYTLSVHDAVRQQGDRPSVQRAEQYEVANIENMKLYLADAAEALHAGTASGLIKARGLMLAQLAALLDAMEGRGSRETGESFRVVHCRRIIRQQLSKSDLSVQWIAAAMSCSADYLSNRFHHEAGVTLTTYINEQRIALAMDLLKTSMLTVSEIAFAAGYASPGYFSRRFKRATGMTAREFRQTAVSR
jgi:AraC-like DNA-binding protein